MDYAKIHGLRKKADLRWITQKYTDYAETIYAIYAEIHVLRTFYAALRSQIITHATRRGGAAPPLRV